MKIKRSVLLVVLVCTFLSIVPLTGYADSSQPIQIEDMTIGILPFHTGCLWWDPFTAGGKWYLEAQGAKVMVQNAQWDTKRYNTILLAWARDAELDGVIAAPLGGEEILPGVRALVKAGIPVAFANNEAGYAPEALFSVKYDSEAACAGLAERVVEMLIEKNGSPKGTIILGLGDSRAPEHIERSEAIISVFEQYPEIEIRSFDTGMTAEKGTTRTATLLRTLPQTDAVISVGMLEFIGMVNALKRENMAYPAGHEKHIICAGVDTAPDVINDAIREGIVDFAVDQPVLAYSAITGYYLAKYLQEGEAALPKPGDIINAEDLNIEVKIPGMDLITPPTNWAPAEVIDTTEEFGHIWIKTNYVIVDKTNVDDPVLWSNITTKVADYGF
ncbi:MAG: sugar ABC transporter substrate-binding protein [Firmicutes bacterium]|jgi:ABC-type sugar transport system substrate-binding protein|nr:sugar ABC transporter substrate-binding protein [Bacillota bacterium]